MAQTKNLCAQIPLELHAQVCEAREQSGLTTAQYIANLLTEYFKMKMNENGGNTTIDVSTFFPYEENRGVFTSMNGRQLLEWITAAHFNAVDWTVVQGTCCEAATLREVDTSTPEYQAFEQKLYRAVLTRMGFEDLLGPSEHIKSQEKEVAVTEENTTVLKLYSPLFGELTEQEYDDPEPLDGSELIAFQEAISQGNKDEQMPEEEERGLMTYFYGSKTVDEKDDCVIITGDFGGIWDGGTEERHWLDWMEAKSFTTLFVSGNHENFDMLAELPIEDWHGGNVQRIRPSVIHLLRGQIYDIQGKTFFTMGGGSSHDIDGGILEPDDPQFKRKCRILDHRNQSFCDSTRHSPLCSNLDLEQKIHR